jgi:transglutaminase-like putative cysteine protease
MDLSINHRTVYHYATPVQQVALLMRLRPTICAQQTIHEWTVSVQGSGFDRFNNNSIGDDQGHHLAHGPISKLVIEAFGRVTTQSESGLISGFLRETPAELFLRQSALTQADSAMVALAQSIDEKSTLDQLHSLSSLVRTAIQYAPGSTNWNTGAASALQTGKGVCQDQAHVFIGCARAIGIPARYVVGYYLAGSDETAVTETHAWAEAFVPDLGWVGFDVTNGVCITDHYVRLCAGFDAHDAAPIRGAMFGAGENQIDADVRISEADPAIGAQVQQ